VQNKNARNLNPCRGFKFLAFLVVVATDAFPTGGAAGGLFGMINNIVFFFVDEFELEGAGNCGGKGERRGIC
jgi:hypothetical protein